MLICGLVACGTGVGAPFKFIPLGLPLEAVFAF